jgi:hypothetical protein
MPAKPSQKGKFTPGPWRSNGPCKPDNTGGRDYCVMDSDGKIIAEVFEHVGFSDDRKSYATRPAYDNANLIAASPRMYEALQAALPFIVGALAFVDCKKQIAQIEAALNLAEGKDSL